MIRFFVEKSYAAQRMSLEDSTRKFERGWKREPFYGVFETRNAAKAAVARSLEPDLTHASEAYCVRCFDVQSRNCRWYRIRSEHVAVQREGAKEG